MRIKKVFFLSICLFFICVGDSFSQDPDKPVQPQSPVESFENIYIHWFFAMDKVRIMGDISREEFGVFSRFSQKGLDSIRGDFMKRIGDKKVTEANVGRYESILISSITSLYKKYKNTKELYPTSVDEFRNSEPVYLAAICDSSCDNIDFESGNLSGWNAYYGFNSSGTTATTISNISGGLAGAVTQAANDTLTSTPGYYNAAAGVPPNASPDYQVNITSGSRGDNIVPSVPVVSPFGGRYSVMLGDSMQVNYGVAILSQTFRVSSSNANFTYQYAVFLANPGHNYYQQPFFKVAVLDQSGDTIPFCGEYNVVSGNGTQKFDSILNYQSTIIPGDSFTVYYKNWTIVNVPLTRYIGQCVTVVFESADCALGGHFGYAYIDASCSPMAVVSSSQNFCGQDSIVLTGPAGEGHYNWTGPDSGIISNDTLNHISIDSAGTYTLVVTPFTGASCDDTLTITIGQRTGPPPHPDFSSDTACAGLSTAFFNSSNPITGASFYWDFYNSGTYEDSTVNPTWIYYSPGTYTVKLHEVYNGCGTDTTIQIVVDSIVNSSFIADTVCFGDTTRFTNTSSGGITYYWNFGDPSSGTSNTSQIINPTHLFGASGSYVVSLIGKHTGWCNDTVKVSITVRALPKPTITATDSICSGSTDILTAGGGSSFLWNTGDTTSSITVTPPGITSYTVRVSNGICSADTSITVYIRPIISGTITGSNVCLNDTIHITATGGGTYLWNTGATTSSISIAATSNSDTAYSVTINNGGGCVTLNKTITIYPLPSGYVCCDTTIFTGTSIIIYTTGGTSYYWAPSTALSCDTCPDPTASPTTTTTYTLITTSSYGCITESSVKINVELPCYDFVVPNVFTPNGDGKNEDFLVPVQYMSKYEISIYNRWGKEVFDSPNPNSPWDGKIDGSPGSAGVYYYIIRATCFNGNYFEKHGFLQLIR